MLLKSERATVLGLSALSLAACLAGCRSEAPPAAPGQAGYYLGNMPPTHKRISDSGDADGAGKSKKGVAGKRGAGPGAAGGG